MPETDLTNRFDHVVGTAHLDLDRLVVDATGRGRRIRNRRRVLAGLASVAAVAVIVGGASLLGADGHDADAPVATADPTLTPTSSTPPRLTWPSGDPVPNTGRVTAAALLDLVGQVQDGTASQVEGQGSGTGIAPETWATFEWRPDSGGAMTPVGINVQPAFDLGRQAGGSPKGYSCEEGQSIEAGSCTVVEGDTTPFFACHDDETACSSTRADGRVVHSYESRHGKAVDRVVDVFDPASRLRVVIASTSASERETSDVVRDEPPLSLEQLRAIATAGVWGEHMPRAYAAEGDRISPYRDRTDQTS